MSGKAASIDGLNLQGSTYHLTRTNANNAPPRDIQIVDIARADYGRQVSEYWKPRTISVEGWFKGSDRDNADDAIDGLKAILGRRDVEFKLEHGGENRVWIGTPRNVAIGQEPYETTVGSWSFELECPVPFAKADSSSTLLDKTAQTDPSLSFTVSPSGTYFAIPEITITINSIDPDDSETEIVLSNPLEDRFLTITGTFSAGDVLSIDCFNGTVFQNTTLLDVSGQFPIWRPKGGTFEYDDNATTRNIDINATYERRYL